MVGGTRAKTWAEGDDGLWAQGWWATLCRPLGWAADPLGSPPGSRPSRRPLGDPTACGTPQYPQRAKRSTQQLFMKSSDRTGRSSAASRLWGDAVALGL